MAITHLLEDFGEAVPETDMTLHFSPEGLEDQRLESFEHGYQAGWDDAVKAQSKERRHVSADLARNLQDLSFTYHEALAAFTGSIKPLLEQMVKTVLPEMARSSLGASIVEQLQQLAQEQAGSEARIRVSPGSYEAVATVLNDKISAPFVLAADDQLADGQVDLSVGTAERRIDMNEVLQGVSAAIDGFFHETDKELKHG